MRWWDGFGWTEHVALPEDDEEQYEEYEEVGVPQLVEVAAATTPERVDDGLLHPRSRDQVFSGAPRGPVAPLAGRARPDRDALVGPVGMQLFGALAVTVLAWYLAYRGVLGDGGKSVAIFAFVGIAVPIGVVVSLQVQGRNRFWWQWCASRGFEPQQVGRRGPSLPRSTDRSPLMGKSDERVVELAARRQLAGRDAVVGSVLRLESAALTEDDDPRLTPRIWRSTFVAMPLPETAAARWTGASIRADHGAQRPITMRAMLGALVTTHVPEARSFVGAQPDQNPHVLLNLYDARLEAYLAEHPMDVDIVGDLLVVMRDGAPAECEPLEELCRDALLLHELLVGAHEVQAAQRQQQGGTGGASGTAQPPVAGHGDGQAMAA